MNVRGRWRDPSDDERCSARARAFFESAAPLALGSVYLNFLTQDETERVREAYGPNWERLAAVKARLIRTIFSVVTRTSNLALRSRLHSGGEPQLNVMRDRLMPARPEPVVIRLCPATNGHSGLSSNDAVRQRFTSRTRCRVDSVDGADRRPFRWISRFDLLRVKKSRLACQLQTH